ncbi:MAG: DUF3800 domain-containing protein [Pseudomonadota bacterium]|nr:DUF3800 domain-containing protein [Pseudomonadota bacterium]
MANEYIIYCDESDESGRFYSDFYGGLLVRSNDLEAVCRQLTQKKQELNLQKELKWQRVTPNYLSKYQEFIDLVFAFIADDKIKMRIMFTQNIHVAKRYGDYHREYKYFLLYYQFIKHAFGLNQVNHGGTRVRLYLDKMPDTKEKVARFKEHVFALNKNPQFRRMDVKFDREQIAEINSKDHVLAQSLDIVLGAMQFRLNDKHKDKPEGQRTRGKRTIAKHKLYNHINSHIRNIYPGFNIGVNTSERNEKSNRWHDAYRHWLFKPTDHEVDTSKGKKKK